MVTGQQDCIKYRVSECYLGLTWQRDPGSRTSGRRREKPARNILHFPDVFTWRRLSESMEDIFTQNTCILVIFCAFLYTLLGSIFNILPGPKVFVYLDY